MFAHATSLKRPDRLISRVVQLGLCLALSACAATRPSVDLPPLTTWELRQAVLAATSDWEFRGRIAVKAGDEGFNGKFNWTQTGQEFFATVGGPLGIGTVTIEGSEESIIVTDKDGTRTPLIEPEKELYERYGWTLPLTSFRYWALGIPDPSSESSTDVDDAGKLISLEQSNWQVSISEYRESAGQQMPRKLTATNPDTRVRMFIDQWMFYNRTGSEPFPSKGL
jgi:outer membrane lipoprotein LolB